MKITYDPDKDLTNQLKHGVSLEFGRHVLADANRLDVLDVRFDYGEERFVSYGVVESRV